MADKCGLKYQTHILNGVNLNIYNKECDREVYREGRCICHFDDPDKPLEPLIKEIYRMSDTNEVDCSYFVFPKDEFRYPSAIRKPLLFEQAKFYGDASFKGLLFGGYTSFHSAEFFGNADFGDDGNPYERQTRFHDRTIFTNTKFHGIAQFRSCIFAAPPEFMGTVFNDLANFALAQIAYDSDWRYLEFRQVEFLKHANLDFKIKGKIPGIAFRFCDLRGLVISSLPRNEIPVVYEEIQKWDISKKWYQTRRMKIKDEETLKDRPIKLVDTYRYLEKYFYENSDFSLASHFYVGQMVAHLRDKNYSFVSNLLNRLYRITSNYGESLVRPVLSILIMWILGTCFLLMLGVPVHRLVSQEETVVNVNWDFTGDPLNTDWKLFTNDFKSAFGSNFSLSTFDRKHELSPPSDSFQKGILIVETALNLVFSSLLIVAARRKFTPKKPTGD